MYSDVMVTKYTTSSLVVLLQPRPFSRALGLVQRRAAIKRLTNANRYLVSLASLASPWPSASPINPQHPQSGFFFRRFSRCAGCSPATPIALPTRVEVEGGWHGRSERGWREQGDRRASCYICNVFAFTIFQLVCILEPLLLASLFVFDSALLFPFSLYCVRTTADVDAAFLPPSGLSPLRRNSFIRAFPRVAFPKTT